MATEAEATRAALAVGLTQAELTPEVLALFGYDPEVPDTKTQYSPVQTIDQAKDGMRRLADEARQGNLGGIVLQAVGSLGRLAKMIGWLVFAFALLMPAGCGPRTEAQAALVVTEASVKSLHTQHLHFEEALLDDVQARERAKIDELSAKAMASITKDVNGVAMVRPEAAAALQQQKLALYKALADKIAQKRRQQSEISVNAANALAYIEGLKGYFEQQAVSYEQAIQIQEAALKLLEDILANERSE